MPNFDELKNMANDALNTAKQGAEGFAAEHQAEIDAARAKVEEVAGTVGATASDLASKALNKAEEMSGQDIDGDGTIAGVAAPEGSVSVKDAAAGFVGQAVDKAEELTGQDLNGDGTVAGNVAAAPAEAGQDGSLLDKVGQAAGAAGAAAGGILDKAVGKAEELTGQDLNGDGSVANAQTGTDTPEAVNQAATEAPEIPGDTFTA